MASDPPRNQHKAAALPGAGPYALRPLLHDVPLSADGNDEDVKINCVEYFGMRILEAVRVGWGAC